MCKWTEKYSKGSEHWLFGVVTNTDLSDEQSLAFGDRGWVLDDLLEVLGPETVLKNLIERVGTDVVLSALEEHLGVPKNTPSVHWKTLKVGDTVEIEDNVHRDDTGIFKDKHGNFIIVEMEGASYKGVMPFAVAVGGATWWPHINSIKGVHGDS